jgi:hypothetical protein
MCFNPILQTGDLGPGEFLGMHTPLALSDEELKLGEMLLLEFKEELREARVLEKVGGLSHAS